MGKPKSEFSIKCPSCDLPIEVNDVLHDQIRNQVESDFDARIKAEQRDVANLRRKIDAEKIELTKSQESLDQLVCDEVEKRQAEIESAAAEKAKQEYELALKDRQSQIDEMTEKVKEFQAGQLELLQEKRKLENEKAELKLKVARELDAERSSLISKTKEQLKQEFDLKLVEKDQKIDGMNKTIDELKRKSEQGSQQAQGEAKELVLENLLESTFRNDRVEPVKKGVRGADSLQVVIDSSGVECGSILWESKRTKAWQNGWLEKLRDDQRQSKSSCAVIVSDVLPRGITTFGFLDGVWVCSLSCVVGLATALRQGVIELAKADIAAEGQSEKMELVYQYLAGQGFQQRVGAIVEAFESMQSDLEKEKRAMNSIWNKRSKQLERAISSTSGLYGDLQGIIGSTLPVLPELSLKKIGDQPDDGSEQNRMLA